MTLENEKFVGERLLFNARLFYRKEIILVQFRNQLIIIILDFPDSLVQDFNILDLVILIILCLNAQRFGLDPQVDILTYQDYLPGSEFITQKFSDGEYSVIRNILFK